MARTLAELPKGARITDFISLGVIAKQFPVSKIHEILEREGRQSVRQRRLPAHVVVYYVIALALYMQVSYGEVLRCLVEGLEWMGLPVKQLRRTGKSGISQARTRVGAEPLRALYQELVGLISCPETQGARFRDWRLVSLDGSTLDLADTRVNADEFGRPGASRGRSGFPQLRFVSLVENGTHVLFGAEMGSYATAETPWHGGRSAGLNPACSVLRTATTSVTTAGTKLERREQTCSGGSRRTFACPVLSVWPTVLI